MRASIIIALTGLIAVLVFGVSGRLFSEPVTNAAYNEPQQSGPRSFTPPTLSRHRETITRSEATLLATRKLAPPGTKSLLSVPAVMRHGDFIWNDDGVAKGGISIWVDLRRQMISAFRDGHEVGTAVIVYGAETHTSPEGRFPILNKQRHYHSRTYDAPMPASLFITNDGVAVHGSPMSSRRASHGCIGIPVKFAEKLFDAAEVGDIVEITRSSQP